jgi:Ca2+-binding RTX toxin-like protein
MPVSQTLNDLSKLALVASDTSYFTSAHPVLPGSALAPLDEGDPTILPRFDFAAGFFEFRQFPDAPGIPTGFKAIAYEKNLVGSPKEVILAFGGTDGPDPTDWVANTQHLGWNQWIANKPQIFEYLNSLSPDTKITFTGQSLGGALAQYAAYEWIQSKIAADPNFDKSRISLVTFNALGGYLGLTSNLGPYQASVLSGLGQAAHYVITGDLVSRLGGDPTTGIGHVGGQVYLLDYRTVNPDTGELVKLDLIEGHRIETGFYAGLHALDAFTVATPLFQSQTPQQWYLPMASLQNTAGLFGNILNGRDVGRAESVPRLLAGLMAGMTFGNQQEWDTLIKAYLRNQHEAGKLSDSKYALYSGANLPATVVGKPVTAAIYAGSVILAGLADALGLGLDAIQIGFRTLKQFLQISSGPAEPVSMSQGEFSQKAVLALAASGAFSDTNSLRREFVAHNLNPDGFVQELLNDSSSTWRDAALAYLRDQLPNPDDKVQATGLAVAFYDTLGATPDLTPADLTLFAQERDAFVTDTASGFANAMADFTQKITNVAFNLGQTISSFADINLIDQAYAAELNDPRLSSSARTAIEEAREIVQRAGQTVVIQKGVGPNPFETPGFVPGGASSATVDERLGELFRLSLPFAAGVGGQRVSLQLQGPQANQLSVSTSNGVQAIGANGVFALTVPEGEDQLYFSLLANDSVSADATVTLSATLVDATDQPTHTTQVESVVSVKAFVGNTDDRYDAYVEDFSTVLLENYPPEGLAMGVTGFYHQTLIGGPGREGIFGRDGDDRAFGNGGDDSLLGDLGHDFLSGGEGNDTLLGDRLDDVPPSEPYPEAPIRGTLDGKDFLDGGNGNDLLGGGGNDDRLIGGAGNDTLWGDAYTAGKTVQHPDGSATTTFLTGVLHPGDDVLEGGEGNDYLSGDGGDDTLDGGTGDDVLVGDTELTVNAILLYPTTPGDDFLSGGAGNDQLFGNAGSDVLLGGTGDDLLYGDDEGVDSSQEGDDWLEGGNGIDQLFGRGGDDTLLGDAGADVLYGGAGNDRVIGGAGDDAGLGGAGDDEIVAGAGADYLRGDVGDELVRGSHDVSLLQSA